MKRYKPIGITNLRRRTSTNEFVLFARINGKLFVEGLQTWSQDAAIALRDQRIRELKNTMFNKPQETSLEEVLSSTLQFFRKQCEAIPVLIETVEKLDACLRHFSPDSLKESVPLVPARRNTT